MYKNTLPCLVVGGEEGRNGQTFSIFGKNLPFPIWVSSSPWFLVEHLYILRAKIKGFVDAVVRFFAWLF